MVSRFEDVPRLDAEASSHEEVNLPAGLEVPAGVDTLGNDSADRLKEALSRNWTKRGDAVVPRFTF